MLSKVVEVPDGELYIEHLVIDNDNHNKRTHRMSMEIIVAYNGWFNEIATL